MKKIVSLILCLVLISNVILFSSMSVFAASYDPTILPPVSVSLESSGTVTWSLPFGADVSDYKSFHIQLQKKSSISSSGMVTAYKWSNYGSQITVKEELQADINIGTTGYYRVRVRCVNLMGDYSDWTYDNDEDPPGPHTGVEVTSDDVSTSYSISGGNTITSGGAVVYNGTITQNPGGQSTTAYGPGYTNTYYGGPNTGVSTSAGSVINVGPGNSSGSIGGMSVNSGAGWQQDQHGKWYSYGDGNYPRDTWALIDGRYYRFNRHGYVRSGWFQDPMTTFWYYLDPFSGAMLTGFQAIGGKIYYLDENKGSTYGVCLLNGPASINGSYYYFDATGAMVTNMWFGGFYYGIDGRRQ